MTSVLILGGDNLFESLLKIQQREGFYGLLWVLSIADRTACAVQCELWSSRGSSSGGVETEAAEQRACGYLAPARHQPLRKCPEMNEKCEREDFLTRLLPDTRQLKWIW